ncbi:MarR family winged helix-turn-helix transcriptional regulator [Microbacterium aurantiacum]|uniref:MarR family winged helix-turn-helix transcriptional regulator n=1 Tax=Microbacterium aurantiacum TaxID=162393 RepID=UPI000C80859E|nr:MarR family transcriptional regulator [Microbacterium aurantiacum]
MKSAPDGDVCVKWSETLRTYHNASCELESELQAQHELGLSEFEVLQALAVLSESDADPQIRMKALEAEMYLSQSALSRTVSRLEKAGLVERGECDFDRRASFLTLTEQGKARWNAASPTHRAVLAKHLG